MEDAKPPERERGGTGPTGSYLPPSALGDLSLAPFCAEAAAVPLWRYESVMCLATLIWFFKSLLVSTALLLGCRKDFA